MFFLCIDQKTYKKLVLNVFKSYVSTVCCSSILCILCFFYVFLTTKHFIYFGIFTNFVKIQNLNIVTKIFY